MVMEDITGLVIQKIGANIDWGWIFFGILVLFIVMFALHHLFDIAVDIWRLPFAIIVDAIALMSYKNFLLSLVAILGAFILFWVFCKKKTYLAKILAIIIIAKIAVAALVFPEYVFVINLLPLCTIATFFLVSRH